MTDDYTCVLSGLTPARNETVLEEHEDEELGDLPVGWTEVRLRRRTPNPEYLKILAVKQLMVQQNLAEVPEADRAGAVEQIRIQVDAMFAALEAKTEVFLVDEEAVYIAPHTRDAQAPGLAAEQLQLFDGVLDVDWIDTIDEGPEGPVEVPSTDTDGDDGEEEDEEEEEDDEGKAPAAPAAAAG
jgi:hypothetical protein